MPSSNKIIRYQWIEWNEVKEYSTNIKINISYYKESQKRTKFNKEKEKPVLLIYYETIFKF